MKECYLSLINETLEKILKNDKDVFLIGEDIGIYGGAFGVTKGLYEKFGENRIIDTPMSEQAIVGMGIGAALKGLRPIVEIMFMDFITLVIDQLMNHAAIFNDLSCGNCKVPITIRTSAGGGKGYGATHSKIPVSLLMSIPGIKIVAPSFPEDIPGLLNSSIYDDSPVIFVEHKLLYEKKTKKKIENNIPLGQASVVKQGGDMTLISYSKTLYDSLNIVKKLEEEKGFSIEVIDLRTIKPIDNKTIVKSVKKTGRVLIIEEGYSNCGIASEIITNINEMCFYDLDAPPARLASDDVPIPCAPHMEKEILVNESKIKDAILKLIKD